MSLRVWLPLNGTLENKGLDNVTVTNSGATVDNNGKIGKCYSFDGSDDYISLNGNALYNIIKGGSNPFSFTMWIYHADNSRAILFGDYSLSGSINFNIELNASHSVRFYWGGAPDTSGGHTLVTQGGWTHIAIVYKGADIKFYKNGILTDTYVGTLTIKNKNSGDYYLGRDVRTGTTALNGKINDFRIYDHALSPLEVKQISQGLILHYPLNRGGWGQENLLKNSNDLTLWNKESGVNCEYDLTVKMYKVFSTTRESSRWGIYQDYSVSVDVDTEYTFSLTGKTDGFRSYLSFGAGSSWPTNYTAFDNNKQRLSKTLTIPAGTTNIRVYLAMYPTTGGGYTYFEKPKLEIGNKATPWCPNFSDALATTMGLNDNVEYDTSGYCNNGTRTGTFSWTSNTPKYAVSQVFNGTDNAIQTPSLPSMISDKNYTIAVWIYKTVIGSKSYQTIYGGPSGFEIEARNGGANETKFVPWNWGKPMASYELNEWNHCVFVHSDSDCKIYLNGEYIATGTAKASNPSGNYFVGAWNTATQQNFDGLMSDFRIYATALSADDVLNLYHTSAYIDDNNNLYVNELSEVTT